MLAKLDRQGLLVLGGIGVLVISALVSIYAFGFLVIAGMLFGFADGLMADTAELKLQHRHFRAVVGLSIILSYPVIILLADHLPRMDAELLIWLFVPVELVALVFAFSGPVD